MRTEDLWFPRKQKLGQIMSSTHPCMRGLPLEPSRPTNGHTLKKLVLPLSEAISCHSSSGGSCAHVPFPCWDLVCLELARTLCTWSQPPWIHVCSYLSVSRTATTTKNNQGFAFVVTYWPWFFQQPEVCVCDCAIPCFHNPHSEHAELNRSKLIKFWHLQTIAYTLLSARNSFSTLLP